MPTLLDSKETFCNFLLCLQIDISLLIDGNRNHHIVQHRRIQLGKFILTVIAFSPFSKLPEYWLNNIFHIFKIKISSTFSRYKNSPVPIDGELSFYNQYCPCKSIC